VFYFTVSHRGSISKYAPAAFSFFSNRCNRLGKTGYTPFSD